MAVSLDIVLTPSRDGAHDPPIAWSVALPRRGRRSRLQFSCANPHRLLRLVLLALARAFLSGHEADGHLVQALHVGVQYRGTERSLLQLAQAQHREKLGPKRPGEFPLLGESEPADYPRKAAGPNPDAGRGILRARKNP